MVRLYLDHRDSCAFPSAKNESQRSRSSKSSAAGASESLTTLVPATPALSRLRDLHSYLPRAERLQACRSASLEDSPRPTHANAQEEDALASSSPPTHLTLSSPLHGLQESGVGQQSGASACQLTDLVNCHAQRDFPPGKPVVKTRSGPRTIAVPRPPSLLCSESRARLRRTRLPGHPPPPGCRLPARAGHRALREVSDDVRRCQQERRCQRERECHRLYGVSTIGDIQP